MVGSSLAAAAGLNAWIPLLAMGLLARFTDLISLPPAWSWLSGDISLWVIGGLLLIEIIADKIPALDTVNDIIHTAIRPVAGGIAFGAGSGAEEIKLDGSSLEGIDWVPVIAGVVIALVVHGLKATARPVANVASAGVAAPVLSTVEDVVSIALSIFAILIPVVAVALLVATVAGAIWFIVRTKRRKATRQMFGATTG